MRDAAAEVVVPTIVLAEIAFLYARKRVGIDVSAVLGHVAKAGNCVIYPLDEAVVERLPTALNIHDAIVVATALVFRDMLGRATSIVTKDSEITASALVDVLW
jgi:predicted nucleic acid-binding protein